MTDQLARSAISGRILAAGAVVLVAIATMLAGSVATASANTASAASGGSCPAGYTLISTSAAPHGEENNAQAIDARGNNNGQVCMTYWNLIIIGWYSFEDDM